MRLEMEVQKLVQLHAELTGCANTMQQLEDKLNSGRFAAEFWKGKGKEAYETVRAQLKTQVQNCKARTTDSATLLGNALETYKQTENAVQTESEQLDAADIF